MNKKSNKNKVILCISDMHVPYHHPDTVSFLEAIKKKYSPTRILCLGDEVDHHALSFHDADPDLFSAGHELRHAINCLEPIYKLFPVMDILESNHGSMVYRKGKHHGVPRHALKSYRDILEAPKTWRWHTDLEIALPNGNRVYFTHGRGANTLQVSQQMSMCVVQGHYHNSFSIQYWGNPFHLNFAMQVGCMIDDKSLAFAYNKAIVKRPIIGHGIIIDGQPKLLPMVLNKRGRWTGFMP